MKYKYLDENYSPSQILWGIRGQLSTMAHTLEELHAHDSSLKVKQFHKVMIALDDFDQSIADLRHFASRIKLSDVTEVSDDV